jgi:sulfatase maturation enzyme AslB (radical SAM superfamily)
MPNQNIFCSAPWYELHIYWDGGLGFCCQENHRLYSNAQDKKYNVATMSIREWIHSGPMRQVRQDIKGDTPLSICRRCYVDETYGPTSRRHKTNQKSVIFTRSNFAESYEQSPGYDKFEGASDVGMPIDLHIDLGNYCNLSCKMCSAQASSTIAVQEVKWGNESARQYVGTDWTRDQTVWNRVVAEIAATPNLSNIHFMGGETLITPRFKDFVQAMHTAGRTDTGISFVTNGTSYDHDLTQMLTGFKRVGIEVSIESLTEHNHYQRQGTDTAVVLANIEQYRREGFEVTLRPAVSALTIGTYWTLLEYALDNQLLVKGQIAFSPDRVHPAVLPLEIRHVYRAAYHDLLIKYDLTDNTEQDYNESDVNQYRRIIKGQIDQTLELLSAPTHNTAHLTDLVQHCKKWDAVHGYNALDLYPELAEEFVRHGY